MFYQSRSSGPASGSPRSRAGEPGQPSLPAHTCRAATGLQVHRDNTQMWESQAAPRNSQPGAGGRAGLGGARNVNAAKNFGKGRNHF